MSPISRDWRRSEHGIGRSLKRLFGTSTQHNFGSYKADFEVPNTGNVKTGFIPFANVSNQWSASTGEPTKKCSEHKEVCPTAKVSDGILDLGLTYANFLSGAHAGQVCPCCDGAVPVLCPCSFVLCPCCVIYCPPPGVGRAWMSHAWVCAHFCVVAGDAVALFFRPSPISARSGSGPRGPRADFHVDISSISATHA